MKIKLYFPSGRVMTHYHNIEALKKSFDSAGMYYEVVYESGDNNNSVGESEPEIEIRPNSE